MALDPKAFSSLNNETPQFLYKSRCQPSHKKPPTTNSGRAVEKMADEAEKKKINDAAKKVAIAKSTVFRRNAEPEVPAFELLPAAATANPNVPAPTLAPPQHLALPAQPSLLNMIRAAAMPPAKK